MGLLRALIIVSIFLPTSAFALCEIGDCASAYVVENAGGSYYFTGDTVRYEVLGKHPSSLAIEGDIRNEACNPNLATALPSNPIWAPPYLGTAAIVLSGPNDICPIGFGSGNLTVYVVRCDTKTGPIC